MSLWEIKYWPGNKDIERWFNKLTENEAKAVTEKLIMLEECGNELRLPHSRSLGKKLFELRERSYEFRIYYAFHEGKVIVLLVAGQKTTQKNDIKLARERLNKLVMYEDKL
jgi:putative addiction module killer protein